MPLTARMLAHIKAMRAKVLAQRTRSVVLVGEGVSATGLALPGAPGVAQGAAGGTFPGGTVMAVVVAIGPGGRTRPGAESAGVAVGANRQVQVSVPNVPGATSWDVYLTSGASLSEVYVGTLNAPSGTFTWSQPIPAAVGGATAPTLGAPLPGLSYALVTGIYRELHLWDPMTVWEDDMPQRSHSLAHAVLDVDSALDLTGFFWVALAATPSAPGVAGQPLFEIVERYAIGIGPSHTRCLLRRTH